MGNSRPPLGGQLRVYPERKASHSFPVLLQWLAFPCLLG
jgi:hypothetical protein